MEILLVIISWKSYSLTGNLILLIFFFSCNHWKNNKYAETILFIIFSYDLPKNKKEAKIIVSIDFYKKSNRVKVKKSEKKSLKIEKQLSRGILQK